MAESMVGLKRTHRCTEVSGADIGSTVTVMGWVAKRRNLGSLIFVDLRDRSGILQILFDENIIGKEGFDKAYTLRNEFVIAVVGKVVKRSGAVNENLKTGDIEIAAESLRILSESETPPFPIEENINTKEDIRLKYRCLDLRRPDIQSNIIMRSKVATLTRAFLAKEGFLEIETPMLTKSTPEGARDYLVPSRIHPGKFYALPQSPQLFKQMLMCSGYDRYMQIARCFRDEDLRADRQPEFTQIDMELSFVDVDDVIDVNERLLAYLFKEVLDIDVQLPIQRMTWQEAMDRFGSDKPDLRFGMELKNVTDIVKNCGFGVFTGAIENGGTVRGINANGQGSMPRKKIDALVDFAKGYDAQCLAGMSFSNALLGIVHSMAHKTGAAFKNGHIIHGAANAMYLPKVIKYNSKDETAKKRYGEIADYMGLGGNSDDEKVDLLIKYLRQMNDDLNIPHCIKNYGEGGLPADEGIVPEDEFLEKLHDIAANAILDACTGSNPRQPSQEEMEKLLKCCYYDTEVDF